MGPHSQAITYDKCVLVTNDKLFHFLSEFVRLSGATQSSNYLRQMCTGDKCTPDKVIDYKLFLFLSEFVRLSGATQSSNYLRQMCTGNKCTPDKAIDGNWKTWSGTKNTNLEWWAAEMEEAARIDKIFVYSSEYSFKYKFKRFKVKFLVACHRQGSIYFGYVSLPVPRNY